MAKVCWRTEIRKLRTGGEELEKIAQRFGMALFVTSPDRVIAPSFDSRDIIELKRAQHVKLSS